MFRIHSQTAVWDPDMLSVEKRSCLIYVADRETVHVTQTGHMPAVLVLSGGKECICSSITVYALYGMFYAYK